MNTKRNLSNSTAISDLLISGPIEATSDGLYDIGSPTKRFGTIYAGSVIGSVSDPDIETNFLRYPYVGAKDLRLYRSAASILVVDDNTGGVVVLYSITMLPPLVRAAAIPI